MFINNLVKNKNVRLWFFPSVLFLLVVLLAALQIHGSSIGIYNQFFNGDLAKDPHLLFNAPQPIRSDEWLVNSGYTIAQEFNHFAEINKNIGNGLNVTIDTDTPYLGWSSFFKPQNIAFFVLPVPYAFAFKWWFIGFILITSCYFFILHFLPNKIWLAIVLSLSLFFSPFIQWWYHSITVLSVAYSFLILVLLFNFCRSKKTLSLLLYGMAITYCLICFALLIYPPFQIPCAITIGVVFAAYVLQNKDRLIRGPWKLQMGLLAISGVITALVVLLFILTRLDAIKALQNTIYPGSRIISSGGYSLRWFLDGFLNFFLQNKDRAGTFYGNQSEASRFIIILPFLVVPMIYLVYKKYRQKTKLDYMLIGVLALSALFMTRLFVPLPNIFFKLIMLHKVPNYRLIIVFGILNIMSIVFIAKRFLKDKDKLPNWIVALSTFIALATCAFVLVRTRALYPTFLVPGRIGILLVLAMGIVVWLVLTRKILIASILLLAICIFSTYRIHPLYNGLNVVHNEKINSALESVDRDKKGNWILFNSFVLNSYLMMNGYHSLSGIYLYPDMKLWERYDDHQDEQNTYNRYAHVVFVENNYSNQHNNFILNQGDYFTVLFDACKTNFQATVDYAMSTVPVTDKCLLLQKTVRLPNMSVYLYKVSK